MRLYARPEGPRTYTTTFIKRNIDEIICIKTPINIIHQRISLRENYSFEKINKIIENQISQDEKCKKSTYCILNDSIDNLKKNLIDIHIKIA